MEPQVSVIIPVYNSSDFIGRCCDTLFGQTLQSIEYIFVDDCTPDKSIQIIEQVLAEYPHRVNQVKIIHHNRNRGLAAARNTAIESCTGEFLTHVDSDDWIELNAVEALVNKQQENDADIVTVNLDDQLGERCHLSDGSFKIGDTYSSLQGDPLSNIVSYKAAYHIWGRLIRVDLYRNYGIHCKEGVNQCEDLQTLPQLAYYCHLHECVKIPLYHFNTTNINSYTYMGRFSHDDVIQQHESFDIFYSFFLAKEPDKYGKVLAKRKMDYLFFLMKLCVRICAKESFNQFKIELIELEDQNKDIKYCDIVHSLRRSYYLTKLVLLFYR